MDNTAQAVGILTIGKDRYSFAGKHKVCSKPSTLSIEEFDSPYPLQSNVCVSRENCLDALLSIEADSRKDGISADS